MERYAYQREAAAWLAERRVALLADPPGSGKSVELVDACDLVGARAINLVCPGIARPAWLRHFETCQQIPRTVEIVESSKDVARCRADVRIVSYALLGKPAVRDALRERQPKAELLIADECQKLKSFDAATTLAFYGKAGLITRAKRVWLASGTACPNNASEWWVPDCALFGGKLTRDQFIQRYCVTKVTKFGTQVIGTRLDRMPELAARMAPHVLRRDEREILKDLPPLAWRHLLIAPDRVPAPPNISIEEAAVLGKLERGVALSVVEQLHLSTLLRWTGLAKSSAVVEIIRDELPALGKVVVFCMHTAVIDAIAKGVGAPTAVIDGRTPPQKRQELIDQFQNTPWPRVLILQMHTVGVAVTLTAARHALFAESDFVPAVVAQSAKRLHRIGQGASVLCRVVSLAGSIDERINAILLRKAGELATLDSLITRKAAA
jgi:SWI/SNF-related matrix-associated actin-dependent regulator of chromatin subfamily A-like protein 1